MPFHFINFAIRTFKRQKMYTAVTVIGLSLALGASLLILSFVNYELNFEKCHDRAERTYRVGGAWQQDDLIVYMKAAMYPLGPAMKEALPEIEQQVRLRQYKDLSVKADHDREYRADKFLLADPEIFDVFTVQLVSGNPQTALSRPHSVVVSEQAARNLFGDVNPLGRTLTIRDTVMLTVTGVMADLPLNTQIHTDFLASFTTLKTLGENLNSWERNGSYEAYTYVLLRNGASSDRVDEKITGVLAVPLGEQAQNYSLRLQPLRDIYFHSMPGEDLGPNGSLTEIYLLIGIALLILFMACFNYVNLTTARMFHRYREIFVRTAVGAGRKQLLVQFLAESVLLVGISMIIGLAFYEISIPYLETYLGQNLDIGLKNNAFVWMAAPVLVFAVGVLSGSYPALLLARIRPDGFLRNRFSTGPGKSKLRRTIIVVQAAIAIGLIGFTVGIQQQLNLARTLDLGFNPDNIQLIEFDREATRAQKARLKQEFQALGLTETTLAFGAPGESMFRGMLVRLSGSAPQDMMYLNAFTGDSDFCATFDLRLKSGRWLTDESVAGMPGAVLVNEATAKLLGPENPVGAELVTPGNKTYTVVGVVEDFIALSLHNNVMPGIITVSDKASRILAVRLPDSRDRQKTVLSEMKETWKGVFPETHFEYSFLNDVMAESYAKERKLMSLFSVSSGLSVFIACLGLLGLVTFTVERRTREIGIRKCIGASVTSIVRLVTGEFVVLVALAGVLAWPLTRYAVNRWLENFAFRIEYGWITYALVVLAILALFFGTVGYRVIKAALTNPVEVLRCE